MVLPWTAPGGPQLGPPDGYMDEQCDMGFDGEVAILVSHASGNVGELHPDRVARISDDPSIILDPSSAYKTTGACLAWTYRLGSKGERFSDQLAESIRTGKSPVVTRERVDGVELVRLTFASSSVWLDPQKGYAFAGMHEQLVSNGQLIAYQRDAVTESAEAAPALWLPLAGFSEHKDHLGELVRDEYRAKRIVANDPKFDQAVFRPAIPAGYRVTDMRTDPAYRSSRQRQEFAKGIAGDLGQEKLARAKEMYRVGSLCGIWAIEHDRHWPGTLEELKGLTPSIRPEEIRGWDQWVYCPPGEGGGPEEGGPI